VLDWTAQGGCPYAETTKSKAPGITPGLLAYRQWVPRNTVRDYRVSLCARDVKAIYVSDCTEGGRLELQRLMKPLIGFADRVQYPLETPSKHGTRGTIYGLATTHYVRGVTVRWVHFPSKPQMARDTTSGTGAL
jgi:hypothetical protein